MKLAILLSHPVQYYAYWFRHLAAHAAFEIEVFYMHRQDAKGQADAGFGVEFEWDVPLLEGYPYRWLDNVAKEPSVRTFTGCDTPEIYDIAEREAVDAFLIIGWNRKSALQAVHAAKRAGIPVLMRGDSQIETPRSKVLSLAKYPVYRAGLPRIDAHLYVGTRNRAYLEHFGVGDDRLFYAPHFVDNAFFARGAAAARRSGRDRAVRAELGIPQDAFVALFVGKLIEKKRPRDLLTAVEALRGTDETRAVHALFVGDGPLAADLRSVETPRTHFAGFRNQSELPAFYAAADALVLPSDGRETWGLVANEAMACGLPVLVSEAVGCAPDLVLEGKTGFTFPLGNVDALAWRLAELAYLTAADAGTLRRAVVKKIEAHSAEAATAGLESALRIRSLAAAA